MSGGVSSITTTYKNGTTAEQHLTYAESAATERQLTLSVTEALSLEETIQAEVNVPAVAKMSDTTTMKVELLVHPDLSAEQAADDEHGLPRW